MAWIIYAIISALSGSAATLLEKKALFREHAMEFATVLAFFNALFTLPLFFFMDYSSLTLVPLLLIVVVSFLASLAFLLMMKSVRHMQISAASPIAAIGPALTLILGFLFLRETITPIQILGVALLILGSYTLQVKKEAGLLEPFREFARSRYIHFMFGGLALYSICAILDRITLARYQVPLQTYIPLVHILIAFYYFIMISIFYDGVRGIKHGLKETRWILPVLSLVIILHRLSGAAAMKIAPAAGLVVSIEKTSTFFTTLIGGELFHEQNLLRRCIAAVIMLAAVTLIILPQLQLL